jgi:putative membrane protein
MYVPGQLNVSDLAAGAPMFRRYAMKPMITAALAGALVLASVPCRAQGAGPTDPQIAAIVVTANQVDIDAGKLAASKTRTKDVKAFADRMVADHSGVNKAASELVQRIGVKPDDNPTSESLKQGGEANVANLKTMEGRRFDKAYIDHEVTYHETVLDALDKTLIPSAQNAELKALLVKVRPAFVAHLEHARHLQASLEKSGG